MATSKLTARDAEAIRASVLDNKSLARAFGVSRQKIQSIRSGQPCDDPATAKKAYLRKLRALVPTFP